MARYRKVSLSIWSDAKFRQLSKPEPNGQYLWLWLIAGPMTTVIPGVIVAGPAAMAERIGWPLEGFRKAFDEGFKQGMLKADFEAHLVWLPKAIQHNPPQSPNVIKSWGEAWGEVPECDLKKEIYQELKDFTEGMGEGFSNAFRIAFTESGTETGAETEDGATKRAQRIPKNFKPNETCRKKATSLAVDIDAELEKFVNHAKSKGRTAKDWQAAFRNWLIKSAEYGNGKSDNKPEDLWRDAI